MDQRISFVTLAVRDVAAARAFYVDGLGWQAAYDGDDVVMVMVGPHLVLSLWDRDDFVAEVGPLSDGPAPITLAHNVADRAAVDTRDLAVDFQLPEIAADGLDRDAEVIGQGFDRRLSLQPHQRQNLVFPQAENGLFHAEPLLRSVETNASAHEGKAKRKLFASTAADWGKENRCVLGIFFLFYLYISIC